MQKRIVALGASVAAIKAMETIKAADPECSLTVFATEKFYPYRPELLGDFLAKRVTEDKLYYRPQSFYKNLGMEFLFDKNLERINLRKNVLITEGKESIPFDVLILSDAPVWKFPDVKGANKSGVFAPYRLRDYRDILEVLPITETVVIEAASVESIQLGCALKERGKDVVLVFESAYLIPEILDHGSSELLMQYLEEFGLRLFKENAVVEVLGEGEVKAARLRSKKVIACEFLVFSQVRPDLRFLSDVVESGGLNVREGFQTPLASVWALGPLAVVGEDPKENPATCIWNRTAILEQQGQVAAAAILGQDLPVSAVIAETTLRLPQHTISLLGETLRREENKEFLRFEARSQGPVYQKIFVENGVLNGAVLINADNEKEKFLRLMKDGTSVGEDPGLLLKSDLVLEESAGAAPNVSESGP